MATISGVWSSPGKNSGRMTGHDRVHVIAGHGVDGCAHARPGGKRQVLFASLEQLNTFELEPGAIRENFTVDGADVNKWPIGQRLRVGGAVFETTMECDPCRKMDELRMGLQEQLHGKRGMLARVLESGDVAVGDEITFV